MIGCNTSIPLADKNQVLGCLLKLFSIAVGVILSANSLSQEQLADEWRSTMAVQPGLAIVEDSRGYTIPTAIAFIPNPGPSPDSPLYFVTELRGSIKAVSNNRTISEFANVPQYLPPEELPALSAQAGLAGICLDPDNGFIFVTFASPDAKGLLRNRIMRFEVTPHTFTGSPIVSKLIAGPVSEEQTALSHQIGGCQVKDNSIFIGIGDGGDPGASLTLNRLLGKVIRMTLDGHPFPDNPFYNDRSEDIESSSYVWAYGLRNPFGLHIGDGVVAVVDNGIAIDRFLKLSVGGNYLWNGRDWSIAAAADAVFAPAVGPVHLDYSTNTQLPSPFESGYFFAASGGKEPGSAGIIHVPYDELSNRVSAMPQYIVSYDSDVGVGGASLAFGPDGLYFAPLAPHLRGNNAVYKVIPDTARTYPTIIGKTGDLISQKECRSCHLIDNQGGNVGPPLDFLTIQYGRLEEKLNSKQYLDQLAQLDKLQEEPFISTADLRAEVRNAKGPEKVFLYVRNQLIEPKFDNPNDFMPNPNLTREEADQIARILLAHRIASPRQRLNRLIASLTPFPATRTGDVLTGLTAGVLGTSGFFLSFWIVLKKIRKRRN